MSGFKGLFAWTLRWLAMIPGAGTGDVLQFDLQIQQTKALPLQTQRTKTLILEIQQVLSLDVEL